METMTNEQKEFIKSMLEDISVDGDYVTIRINKEIISSPLFIQSFADGSIFKCFEGKDVNFLCYGNLFFNETEALNLAKNVEFLTKNDYHFLFVESVWYGSSVKQKRDQMIEYNPSSFDTLRTFEEVMQINDYVLQKAKAINSYSKEREMQSGRGLSPLEKLWLCREICNRIEYFAEEDKSHMEKAYSHSYIETIKEGRGCCVGKSVLFKTLCSLVGLNICSMIVDGDHLSTHFYETILKNKKYNKVYNYSIIKNLYKKYSGLYKAQSKGSKKFHTDHMISMVCVDDDKYDYHGSFAIDASSIFIGTIEDLFNLSSFYSLSSNKILGQDFDEFIKRALKNKNFSKREKEYIEKTFLSSSNSAVDAVLLQLEPNQDIEEAINKEAIKKQNKRVVKCRTLDKIQAQVGNFLTLVSEQKFREENHTFSVVMDSLARAKQFSELKKENLLPYQVFEALNEFVTEAYPKVFEDIPEKFEKG